jgi:hypothetical protein
MIYACGYRYQDNAKTREVDEVWRESFKKWRQTGPLLAVEALRRSVTRAVAMKDGIKAFFVPDDPEIIKRREVEKAMAMEAERERNALLEKERAAAAAQLKAEREAEERRKKEEQERLAKEEAEKERLMKEELAKKQE